MVFVNTIEKYGDETTIDSIIDRTITEFKDDTLTTVGNYAFYGCSELEAVDLPNVTTIKNNAFASCLALTEITTAVFPNLTQLSAGVFNKCTGLTHAIIPTMTIAGTGVFNGCTSLKIADIFAINSAAYDVFYGCTVLTALAIRNTAAVSTMVTTNVIGGTPIASGTGYIYVPSALIEDYKVATNWSTYADYFRALEDYTIDGTTTGELDESKI